MQVKEVVTTQGHQERDPGVEDRHVSKKGTGSGLFKLNFCSQTVSVFHSESQILLKSAVYAAEVGLKSTRLILSLRVALSGHGMSFKDVLSQ